MLRDIPLNVQHGIRSLLEARGRIELHDFIFSSGGCINHGGRLKTNEREYFLKWNSARKFPAMFEVESRGLQLLRTAKAMTIPEVVGFGSDDTNQFLVLAFIEQGAASKRSWETLGRQLSILHKVTNDFYGLDHNNYIGSLTQHNEQHVSWHQFFIERRLGVQLKLAVDSGLIEAGFIKDFESFYTKLPSLIPEEKPSLLHGDLWSGNIIFNQSGEPCLIDPAVYYGHREADLAMTRLFETFNSEFYASYEESFPLLPGYAGRVDIYNLYPLLVHLNLFGGTYLRRITAILKDFR
jgi:protein-ribulosamine 3-kinase